ncbi:hypothetical protein ACPWT1_02990 [Ramlibacter sp. MMS24-I3-19]|uniref:hypothetical protein n=1 Tax=Ramlibacter sp. MMS24-I3-19 TaxID=3416606 RepID=UPI003CFFD85B
MSHPHPDLCQQQVDALLRRTGLLRPRGFEADALASVDALRQQAAHFGPPVVLSLLAAEVPDLIPQSLSSAQVLYFVLPESMESLVPQLLTARWDCYGHLTEHPWTHGVYLALKEGVDACAHAAAHSAPLLAFRSEAIDLTHAFGEGFAILMFDCAGQLWARGIPSGEDLATGLSACTQSTFQRPLRIHSVKSLQERTRLVEETGVDPEGPAAGGCPVLPVVCSELAWPKPFDLAQLPEARKRHLPKASWHRICDAALGWLPELTHFQEECAGESPLVLKVTVMPEMFRRIQSGDFSAVVRLAAQCERAEDPIYVLMVESAHELTVVTMPSCDRRFRAVYRYWARVGRCQLVFENFHNGRLHRSRVAWPATAPRKCDPVDGLSESGGSCSCAYGSAADALVNERVRENGACLTCYVCGVTDQEGWRQAQED